MNNKHIYLILIALLHNTQAYCQNNIDVNIVPDLAITKLEARMVDSKSTKRITDSLYNALKKEPAIISIYESNTSIFLKFYQKSVDFNKNCKSCVIMRDSLKRMDDLHNKQVNEAIYKYYIEKAETKFSTGEYFEAVSFYIKARETNPAENYPKQRIVEIEVILQQNSLDKQKKN